MADAIRQLDAYFSDPAHHSADKDHVTRDDLALARGKLGPDTDALIDALVFDNDAYNAVRENVKESAWGWVNDRDISMADLHKAASTQAPATMAGRLAKGVDRMRALGDSTQVAYRYRDVPEKVGSSKLGWVTNSAQIQGLLAMSPPDVVARYEKLQGSSIYPYGRIEDASLVHFILARGGDDALVRYRDLAAHHMFEFWGDSAAVAAALVAFGPPGTLDRYKALAKSGANFGWVDKASVARAVIALAGADAEGRFRALKPGSEFGWVEEEGLARAIIAAGPPDALERYRGLKKDRLDFGWVENAGVTRALVAVSGDQTADRYRALGQSSLSFGWVEQAGVTQAELARGSVFAPLPAVPSPAEADDDKKDD